MTKEKTRAGLFPVVATMGAAFLLFGILHSPLFPWAKHRSTAIVALWLYLPLLALRLEGRAAEPLGADVGALRSAVPILLRTVLVVLLPFSLLYGLLLQQLSSVVPPIALPSTWSAFLNLLAFHALFAAIPEEFFFRAYLQQRLDRSWTPRWTLFGARLGPGWLVANLSFTLCHLLSFPAPHRALVFLPGMLFGWIRARTGSFWAAAALHFLSNLLLILVPEGVRCFG